MKNTMQYIHEEITYITQNHIRTTEFSIWHIEALLNQSADLLDRCLSEMQNIEALEANWKILNLNNRDLEITYDHKNKLIKNGKLGLLESLLGTLLTHSKHALENLDHAKNYELQAHGNSTGSSSQRAGAGVHNILSQMDNVNAQNSNLQKQIDWEQIESKLTIDTHRNSGDLLKDRIDATKPGNSLSYDMQAKKASERLLRDFKDAYSRLVAASDGLSTLFGYENVLHPETEEDPLQHSIIWVRNAIGWLAAILQRDQSFSITLSLKTIVSNEEWLKQTNNLSDPLHFLFHIPKTLFRNHINVRLRGVCGYISSENLGSIPWTMIINLPKKAVIEQTINSNIIIDQSLLPSITLGRIEKINSNRSPEIIGMTSVRNASVIGDSADEGRMQVEIIIPDMESQESPELLNDVLIELLFVGQPK